MTSEYSEAGLGLYYYGARYYDANGRFLAVDPALSKYYNHSPYIYCANNPLKFVDPDGEAGAAAIYGVGAAELAMAAITLAAVQTLTSPSDGGGSGSIADNASINVSLTLEFATVLAATVVTGTCPDVTESTGDGTATSGADLSPNVESSRTKQHERTNRQPPPTSARGKSKESKRARAKPEDSRPTNDTATRDKGKGPKIEVPTQLKPEKPAGKPWPWPPPYWPSTDDNKDKKHE